MTSASQADANSPAPRRATRSLTGALIGAIGGLAFFVLAAVSAAIGWQDSDFIRVPATPLPRAQVEVVSVTAHIVGCVTCIGIGGALGLFQGRRRLGARWRWITYGALTGIVSIFMISYVIDLRFPNAEPFDYSEEAAFEFKFRAAQVLATIGAIAGFVSHQLQQRRRNPGGR